MRSMRPEQVDRRRPGRRQRLADGLEIGAFLNAQRHAHRRRHADRRGAADHHGLDRVGDFEISAAGDEPLLARQAGLIDHDHARVGPLDGFHHELSIVTGATSIRRARP